MFKKLAQTIDGHFKINDLRHFIVIKFKLNILKF